MVYRQDNRIKKHRGRYTALGIFLGIILAVSGIYVYENYKQNILDIITPSKTGPIIEYVKPNSNSPAIQMTIKTKENPIPQDAINSKPILDNTRQNIPIESQPIQSQQANTDQQIPIDVTTLEHQIHEQINNARQQNGLKPLQYDEKIATIARDHSKDMGTNNYFDHITPNGKTVQDRFYDAKYPCNVGENIEQAVVGDSPESIVQLWMNSSGHRANILGYSFNSQGLGVFVSGQSIYITDDFC